MPRPCQPPLWNPNPPSLRRSRSCWQKSAWPVQLPSVISGRTKILAPRPALFPPPCVRMARCSIASCPPNKPLFPSPSEARGASGPAAGAGMGNGLFGYLRAASLHACAESGLFSSVASEHHAVSKNHFLLIRHGGASTSAHSGPDVYPAEAAANGQAGVAQERSERSDSTAFFVDPHLILSVLARS